VTYSANSYAHGSFLPVESNARSESGTACTCIFYFCPCTVIGEGGCMAGIGRDSRMLFMVLMRPRNKELGPRNRWPRQSHTYPGPCTHRGAGNFSGTRMHHPHSITLHKVACGVTAAWFHNPYKSQWTSHLSAYEVVDETIQHQFSPQNSEHHKLQAQNGNEKQRSRKISLQLCQPSKGSPRNYSKWCSCTA
jgi:hypothetical protein